MSTFKDLVTSRRTANKFLPGYTITRDEITEIVEEVSQAPSCFNLQHTRYYAGITDQAIDAMHKASGQYKVSTASGVVIVTGDKLAYQKAESIYEGSKFLKIIDDEEYDYIIKAIKEFHESKDSQFLTDEAIRNASLSAMLFMLSAKDKGWDTSPMIFFDDQKVRDYFNIPDNEEIVLMIGIGKIDDSSTRIRGYRKPAYEILSFS